MVGPTGQELVDQVALRPHDLHPVISGFAGQQGAADIVADGLFHPRPLKAQGLNLLMGALPLEGPRKTRW